MESNLLQLCEMVGICVGRNKTETLHRLMRPMIAQELFRFVSLENERTKVENQIDISKWKNVHPGSKAAIVNHNKEDISQLFRQIHESSYSWNVLYNLQK